MDDWERMDRTALDDAYANAEYIPDAAGFPARWQAAAAAFRDSARCDLDIAYTEAPGAAFDLFHPVGPPRGLTCFVHGGYWRRFDKSDWSHLAAGALETGQAVAMIGYPLAPAVRIAQITALVAQAIDAAAARIGGPVRLTGHSAGGHLVARAVMPGAAPACARRIASCVPISPVADLRPLVPQTLNADWRLDPREAAAESPALGRPMAGPRIAVHVGADERPSFLWQARQLAEGWDVPLPVISGQHHFDVIDALSDPGSALMRDILA